MKSISLFSFWALLMIPQARAQEYTFKAGKSYSVVGRVKESRQRKLELHLLENTSSTYRLKLENESGRRIKKNLIIEVCIVVAQDCEWQCEGKLQKFSGIVAPWDVPEGMAAIKEKNNCL